MASIDWHADLPQTFQKDGFSTNPDSGVIRTDMEVGPAKTRRRTTAVSEYYNGTMIMTLTQLNLFRIFFKNTLNFGSLRFNFPDQLNPAVNLEARFVDDGTPYTISPDGTTLDYRVGFSLEVF